MFTRAASTPETVRRGLPPADGVSRDCTSATSGRRPSSVTVTHVPSTGSETPERNRPEGSSRDSMPSSRRSKQPTSSVGPKRFFTARTRRSREWRSPSNWQTTSTRCSSSRGPAMVPSFVTWPTRTVVIPFSLAVRMRLAATSRTWLTPPAIPSTSVDCRVCTESTITSSGSVRSICPSARPRSVSAVRRRVSAIAPIRSARERTCAADSSPVRYSTERGPPPPAPRAVWAATSNSSVDLPMPGSPASRITAPGTRPPPSTRSSSRTPVERNEASVASTSAMRGATSATVAARVRPVVDVSPISSTVPHDWHSPQRPTHFTVVQPHSVQRYPGARFGAVLVAMRPL